MNKKIYTLIFCMLPALLSASENIQSASELPTINVALLPIVDQFERVQTRPELLQDYVAMYQHLDEGFDVIHDQYRSGPTFYEFLDTHLIADGHDEESESNFGDVIGQAEDYILKFMKPRFLKRIDHVIVNPSSGIYNASNPACTYVMKYRDEFMKIVVEKWVNGKDFFKPDKPIIECPVTLSRREIIHGKHIDIHMNKKWTEKPKTLLSAAVKNDNEMMVRLLVDLGADINDYHGEYQYPLHDAVLYSSDMVALLLELKAHYDVQDGKGATPLWHAVTYNKVDAVHALLDAGANPILANNAGDSPLHEAAHLNRYDIAEQLLHAGANIDAKNNDGQTPVILAAFHDSIETAKLLLKKGANTSITDNHADNAFMKATTYQMRNVITNGGNESMCVIS